MTTAGTPDAGGAPAPAAMGRSGATRVAVASGVAAVTGWAVLAIAARVLSTSDYTDFLAFWSLLFLVFGVLAGVQTETTRGTRRAAHGATGGARALPVALCVGAALALALAATSPWWASAVLGDDATVELLVLLAACVLFAGHSAQAGSLSGTGRWERFGDLVGLESLVRLAASAAAAAVGAAVAGFAAAAAAGTATWLLLLAAAPYRSVLGQRVDVAWRPFVRRLGHAMAAATASAVVVVGFPVLLRLTSSPAEYDAAAGLMLAVSLTRAPLMIPLTAFQGVVITQVVEHPETARRRLRTAVLAIAGIGLVGAALAALVGPPVMELLLTYRVTGRLLGALTLAAVGLAVLTLTGAVTVALDRHRAFSTGWLVATGVTVALLLAPWSTDTRATVALLAGPVAGVVVHLLALGRRPGARR